MNRIIYLCALALILTFALIACGPEADITAYSWDNVNTRDDPANGGNVALPELPDAIAPAARKNPKISILFPLQADILRASNVEEELKKFLSVHTFENKEDMGDGSNSTIHAAIKYKFVRTIGANIVEIQLEKDFSDDILYGYSNLVVKIEGTKYTYSRGFKMDIDQNGVGGEEFYDDLYLEQNLEGSNSTVLIPPGHREFHFYKDNINLDIFSASLAIPSNWSTLNRSNSLEIESLAAISFNIDGINAMAGTSGLPIYKVIGDQFASGFKLQEYSNGAWTDVKTAVYDAQPNYNHLYFKNITIKNAVPYRIRWTGAANLETSASYFSVKQRPYIWLGDPADKPSSKKLLFARTEATTDAMIFINSAIYTEITTLAARTLHSHDTTSRNAVIKFTFPIQGTGGAANPYVGLKELPLADFQGDDAAFKIYSAFTNLDDALSGKAGNNLVKIEKVEYKMEGNDPVNASVRNETYKNALYITIDPNVAYNNTNFRYLINNKFAYEGTDVTRVFGDANQFVYGGYRVY